MNFSALVAKVADLAQKIIPTLIPGAAAAVEVGKAALDLVNDVKETVSMSDEEFAQLDGARAALESAVNAHVAAVEDRLRG